MNHFKRYLAGGGPKAFVNPDSNVVPPDDPQLDEISNSAAIDIDSIDYDYLCNFGYQLFDCFATYLTQVATWGKENAKSLSLGSTKGYLSTMKSYYLFKLCINKTEPSCFTKIHWGRIQEQVYRYYWDKAKHEGTGVVKSKETASTEDLLALGLLCLWGGRPEFAEYMHLNASMVRSLPRLHYHQPNRFLLMPSFPLFCQG